MSYISVNRELLSNRILVPGREAGMSRMIILETVPSTNAYLKENPRLLEEQFLVVRALEQTAGRGRENRTWYSSAGRDIAFSMVFLPAVPLDRVSAVTLYAGLALYRALEAELPGLALKWPNDLLIQDKKLCGILCELVPGPRPAVIIGVGLNVNTREFPPDLAASAVSMYIATGKEFNVDELFISITRSLEKTLDQFAVPMKAALLREWEGASNSLGRRITGVSEGEEISGIIKGVTRFGALLVETAPGRIVECTGEVQYQ